MVDGTRLVIISYVLRGFHKRGCNIGKLWFGRFAADCLAMVGYPRSFDFCHHAKYKVLFHDPH